MSNPNAPWDDANTGDTFQIQQNKANQNIILLSDEYVETLYQALYRHLISYLEQPFEVSTISFILQMRKQIGKLKPVILEL